MGRMAWVASGLVILVAVAGAYLALRPDRIPAPQAPAAGNGNAAVGASGTSRIVTYSDSGFSPSSLTVPAGTTITWSNESSRALEVQPSEEAGRTCDGGNGSIYPNECASISSGGTYSFTFTVPGTYSYVNSQHVDDEGSITVRGDAPAAGPLREDAQPE